ncbi:MAG: NAD(P)H-dependent oxidoreductase [Spirochaetes bacterium]|nr:NAD(P)H-dependent oxidoreductase [Spirochaetota bacterium]
MKKILTVYFSYSGNTRIIAEQIHEIAGGDIMEIQAAEPYPEEYNDVVDQARRELKSGRKPRLKSKSADIASYDLIILGFPNWCGTFPAPITTFLSENDLSGKTIAPFCTHEGGGSGRSAGDLSTWCPRSTLLEGIAIRGRDVKGARSEVTEWLRKNKISD